MFDVLCVSDCCCDLVFKGLAKVPDPGTEEYCEELYLTAGGGANTPSGLARLGCCTAYLSAVGDDAMGDVVCAGLAAAGVDACCLQREPGARTWVSAVLSTKKDRAFASYAGSGVACTRGQLEALVRGARWVHTYSCYCEKFPFLPEVCRAAGVPFSLDAAFDKAQTLDGLRSLLGQAALFTPNDVEACALTGEASPLAALAALAEVCPHVVVTLGAQGALAFLDGRFWRVRPPQVEAVDPNGAGDLFNAGLIAARLEGQDAAGQLRLAAASGALAVTYPGGMDVCYTRRNVEALARAAAVEPIDPARG